MIGVNGMTCANCKKAIEEALGNLEGVSSVSVDLEESNVTVNYDENVVELGDIRLEIENQGYDVVQ
ncbi:MAG TPA: copper ion binding protein [Pseudogracilibacillus sp.]|nr:copper ion binding protein [Pseudogracilibacillus sp.]